MQIRGGVPADLEWAPEYILKGIDTRGYVASPARMRAYIEAAISNGITLVAENRDGPCAVIGGLVQPIVWAERDELVVMALRSTFPGAGFAVLRALLEIAKERVNIKRVLVTFDQPEPRLHDILLRYGGQPIYSYSFTP